MFSQSLETKLQRDFTWDTLSKGLKNPLFQEVRKLTGQGVSEEKAINTVAVATANQLVESGLTPEDEKKYEDRQETLRNIVIGIGVLGMGILGYSIYKKKI